jgi:hypothetical protein
MPIEGIQVHLDTGDPPQVTKRGIGPRAQAQLRSEAAILAAARHPGVVALVHAGEVQTPTGDAFELRTRLAGSRTLATMGAATPARIAAVMSSLSATVADLHRLGIVHGRISADHVVVAGDGRPVLCGFSHAQLSCADDDPSSPHSAPGDVAALGDLLHHLLGEAPDPHARPASRWTRRSADGVRRVLQRIADEATDLDPLRRPTAARLADSIQRVTPAMPMETPDAAPQVDEPPPTSLPTPRSSPSRPAPRRAVAAGVAAVAALVGLLVWTGSSGGDPGPDSTLAGRDAPISVLAAPSVSAKPSEPAEHSASSAPPSVALDAAGCSTTPAGGTTAAGEPCPVEVHFDGGTLVVGVQRFRVDLLRATAAIGDFGCDGRVAAAVVDLDTGDVFVFDAWATATAHVTAVRLDRVPEARQVTAEPDGAGCHRVVVHDQWGLRHQLAPPPTAPTSPTSAVTDSEVSP